jgi:rod shape determining protein RodA
MAHYLDGKAKIINHPKVLSVALLITGVPALMVLKQPDLGTSLVFGAILMGMLFWAGLSLRELGWLVSPAISLLVAVLSGFNWIVWSLFMAVLFGLLLWVRPAPRVFVGIMVLHIGIGVCAEPLWDSLHDYQRQRVVTFLDPQEDALGAGYQIIQSKIAIGSGGLTGRGYLQGTQTQLSFLPEQQTDFIFSVIGEELGFIGSTAVLLMLYILIYRGVKIAVQVRSRYHSLVAAGCVSVLAFHVIMNVGMTLGLLPVAGVPLPFLSYGGSFLLTCMTLCGLLMNVWKRRFEY